MTIKSSNGRLAVAFAAAAIVWMGLSSTLFVLKLNDGMRFGCSYLILLTFVFFGVLLGVWAASHVVRWFCFRGSYLTLGDDGGTRGATLMTSLHVGRPLRPAGPMVINPRCIRHEIYRTSGPESETRSSVTILWRDEHVIPIDAIASGAPVPINFLLPSDLPVSDATPESGGIRWQLEVLIPSRPVDFHTTFEFPVKR
jgi:hypothetical protein